MNSPLPVLTTIKSDWKAISESPVLGKDVLELLSSSMYINPLSIYREYVQNAADSIEEAAAIGLLRRCSQGKIDIRVDSDRRSVTIRDNGTGINNADFVKRLVALGASRKRGLKARGFRGVGRLSGLGYCQELIFRSRADGEPEANEMRWDCRRLKMILRDSQFSSQLPELIKEVVRIRRIADTSFPKRFFEVELVGIIRHGADSLMNGSLIGDYLSQVAPVPFSRDFAFGDEINAFLADEVHLGNIHIFINGSEEPIYRPHRNSFVARKGLEDELTSLETFSLDATNGSVAALGWIIHHGYHGTIPTEAGIGGLRVRCGNMQIGERDLLDELFHEPRFNGWVIGEIHVLDERILPNGRRDHFEQSVHFNDLLSRMSPMALELTRRCRLSSIERNLQRQIDALRSRIDDALALFEEGALTVKKHAGVHTAVATDLVRLEKLANSPVLQTELAASERNRVGQFKCRIDGLQTQKRRHKYLDALQPRDRKTLENVFGVIYDCAPNPAYARSLIDQILRRLNATITK